MDFRFLLAFAIFQYFATVEAVVDPLNIFCGSKDCYEVLELDPKSASTITVKDIKKAYRHASLKYHPDKNKHEDAASMFREVAKAQEVLSDEEQRQLYDYYLAHPNEYYKVTGQFYYRQLPKADVRLIVLFVLVAISVLQYIVQHQRHNSVKKYLFYAASNNLGLRSGGSKQTLELYKRAYDAYATSVKEVAKSNKLTKDERFLACVKQVVDEVQVEGGYKKPSFNDVILMKTLVLPYSLYLWVKKLYRKLYIPIEQMGYHERKEYSIAVLGLGTWESLSEDEQHEVLNLGIWRTDAYAAYVKQKEEEHMAKHPTAYKKYQRHMKKQS